jgi:hypothetical protein
MRLQGLALCLLVACGGSSKHAQAPVTESTTTTAPGGGEPAEGAAPAPEPVEAATPAAPAAAPMATDTKVAPKPKTRGAQKKGGSGDEDPDAGGE